MKAGSELCPNGGLLGGAGVAGKSSPGPQDTHKGYFTHSHQPRLPNEGSGSGGWETYCILLSRGLGPCPHTWAKWASGVLDARCVYLYDMHTACPKARHVHTNTTQRQAPNPLSFVFTLFYSTLRVGGVSVPRGGSHVLGARSTWCGPLEISGGKEEEQRWDERDRDRDPRRMRTFAT